ncbi:MAG TPA: hypothetical protein VFE42_23715 [Chloroflexota bacterium]|nr:hypothetical protein [Chloroflexota bacterium]
MATYARVLCTSPAVPTVRQVLQWTADDGYHLELDPEFARVGLDSPDWHQVGLIHKMGKSSVWIEIDDDADDEDSLVRQEVAQFEQEVSKKAASMNRGKVLAHLANTCCIVAIETPFDFDEYGAEVVSSILGYFIEHCGGLVQADGYGFYEGEDLILEE